MYAHAVILCACCSSLASLDLHACWSDRAKLQISNLECHALRFVLSTCSLARQDIRESKDEPTTNISVNLRSLDSRELVRVGCRSGRFGYLTYIKLTMLAASSHRVY